MGKYILRRVIQAIPVLVGISMITYFILLIAPGGPYARFAQNPRITAAQIEAFAERWGLNDPIPLQYCKWLGVCGQKPFLINALPGGTWEVAGMKLELPGGDNGVLHGDFGYSITDGRPVTEVIGTRILPTIILAGTAYVIWVAIAFFAGVYAAVKRYTLFDSALTVVNYVGFSLPTFWLGLMLITLLASPPLKWFPVSGMWNARQVPTFGSAEYWTYFGANTIPALYDLGVHLVLPVFTLVFVNIAADSRFIRSAMIDSLNQDFVRTARAKGVSERRVIFRHALRNALLPVVTNIGLEIPFLFTGAIVTETIFSWPGIGKWIVEAIGRRDYPAVQGGLLMSASVIIGVNLLVDVMYGVINPRIRHQ